MRRLLSRACHRDFVGEIHSHSDVGLGCHERFIESLEQHWKIAVARLLICDRALLRRADEPHWIFLSKAKINKKFGIIDFEGELFRLHRLLERQVKRSVSTVSLGS